MARMKIAENPSGDDHLDDGCYLARWSDDDLVVYLPCGGNVELKTLMGCKGTDELVVVVDGDDISFKED